ncbi:SPX (SYG1/Pho81/XPR1) domain-containing protein [Galdieria sulphuraria]|uniref:SPX (SYG1/Pho81/XPR1) domain-containing protein n=1 Tax=Galdieria sulphuraria TaxID=130081 RepID=M2WR45_GALSU|nr:SPX (SYG1/Pho81/XPR1) domain-containing protein [Galdieria sulphuraria]EME26275.1 SPX (SYG1/Pho81/XPR1) domain-containing protein [Galdieria sulphuraria]|eukprot:XP_005702795.1 SPX (SYG1/Pho81/XPR1) domain-containing protein [Galdieria sulphuraria]
MKFGKKLQDTVETANKDWRPYFIDYKGLKKLISSTLVEHKSKELNCLNGEQVFPSSGEQPCLSENRDKTRAYQATETEQETTLFVTLKRKNKSDEESKSIKKLKVAIRSCLISFFTALKQELDKVNDFYLDKEEELIISHHMLKAYVAEYVSSPTLSKSDRRSLKRQLIDLHGNAVMLESYATVNYTGFRKILKKLDKKTGFNFRKKYLEVVWGTPFFSLSILQNIVKETEKCLNQLEQIAAKCS